MNVKQAMTPAPVTVTPEETVPNAVALLRARGFRRLPVMQGGRLVGMVTDRDLKEAMPSDATSLSIWEVTYLLAKLTVRDVMARSVITVTEDTPLNDAAHMMLQRKISGLPVVNDAGELTGIVTVTDVLREYIAKPATLA